MGELLEICRTPFLYVLEGPPEHCAAGFGELPEAGATETGRKLFY